MTLPPAIKRLFAPREAWGHISHDNVPLTTVVFDPECPSDQVHTVNGFVVVPSAIALRLPDKHDGVINSDKGVQPCWKLADLETEGAPGQQ